MGIFSRNKKKTESTPEELEDKNSVNVDESTGDVDESPTEFSIDNPSEDDNDSGFALEFGTLGVVIKENIGQGSKDVKEINVTFDDGTEITASIANALVKNVATKDLNPVKVAAQRLSWFKGDAPDKNIQDAVTTLGDEDFFTALSYILKNDPEYGQEIAEIIAKTYADVSDEVLRRHGNRKIVGSNTSWAFGSDTDAAEAYEAFSIDPTNMAETIEELIEKVDVLRAKVVSTANEDAEGYQVSESDETPVHFNNFSDVYVYETDGSRDYAVNTESEVERYILATIIESYDYLSADHLADIENGFSVADVLSAILELQEKGQLTFLSPEAIEIPEEETEEEEVPEEEPEEPEEIPEEELEEEEFDLSYDEDEPESYEDVPYPPAIKGGTAYIGGALNQYVNDALKRGAIIEGERSMIEYALNYNSLFERSVLGVETSMSATVGEFERSFEILSAMAALEGKEVNKNTLSSNLIDAAEALRLERDSLNSSRKDFLDELLRILNLSDTEDSSVDEAIRLTELKLKAIEEVESIGYKEKYSDGSSDEIQPSDTPLFYEVLKSMGYEGV